MGLAERKQKQKIGADPRNLTWSEDNSRFGQQYLAKYGWDRASGQGLGANGDGRTKHISVVQKLNSMGIGGTKAGGPDTIAWKQNRDFEMVLKRLNVEDDDAEDEEEQAEKKKKKKSDTSAAQAYLQGFVRAKRIEGTIENAEVVIAEEDDDPSIMKAKRSDKKKKRKEDAQAEVPDEKDIPKIVPRAAHRAKFRRSKQLASISSAALSEILGVSFSSPTASTPGTDLTTAEPSSSSLSNTPPFNAISSNSTIHGDRRSVTDNQLTTSTTSVADYFAAKMKARREQLNSSLQNAVISDKASDPPDPLYERPSEVKPELDKPMKKKRKKERIEKRAGAASGEDQKEVSSALDVDVDEPRKRKRRKKEEKADGSKKKKRLKAEA